MSIVAEKIPCNTIVTGTLQLMVKIPIVQLQFHIGHLTNIKTGSMFFINFCFGYFQIYELEDLAKANLTKIDAFELAYELTHRRVPLGEKYVFKLLTFDTTLSTRLPDQDFTNLKKLTQFVFTKMSIDGIGHVLVSYQGLENLNVLMNQVIVFVYQEYVYGPEQYKMETICGKDSI